MPIQHISVKKIIVLWMIVLTLVEFTLWVKCGNHYNGCRIEVHWTKESISPAPFYNLFIWNPDYQCQRKNADLIH